MTRTLSADWLMAPGPRAILAMLERAGHRAYFVGGCVRNALLGAAATDIDIATDARPERVLDLAKAAGLRAAPTGLAHGTVTLVTQGQGIEVTTFRRDVATDGRRAVVAFGTDLAEDARRRDFTMNALYADGAGRVLDPVGGLPDLAARRVRFVGAPDRRIAEDYLRILRFFRFHAWYGDPARGADPAALAACAAGVAGLARLSRERVTAELCRLLAAPDPAAAVALMAEAGCLDPVLPGADPAALPPLIRAEAALEAAPDWPRRMAALLPGPPAGLRLARADRRRLAQTAAALAAPLSPAAAAFRWGADVARDARLIAAARAGRLPEPGLEAALARGAAARLPVRAADLPHRGPALGRALARLEAAWLASDLTLDRDTLLALDRASGK